jgi:hypothetical protein
VPLTGLTPTPTPPNDLKWQSSRSQPPN